MKFKIEPKFNGTGQYEIIKRNIKTGEISVHTQCNILTDHFLRCLKRRHGSSGYNADSSIAALQFGDGSGDISSSNYKLFNYLWGFGIKIVNYGYVNNDYTTYRITVQATIPPDAKYVGTITEIGASNTSSKITSSNDYNVLFSHALLKDAEGNPISIEKTDLDEIVVNYTLTVSLIEDDIFKLRDSVLKNSTAQRIDISAPIFRRSTANNSFETDKTETFYNYICLEPIKGLQTYNSRRFFREMSNVSDPYFIKLLQYGKLDESSMCVIMNTSRLAASNLNNQYIQSILINNCLGSAWIDGGELSFICTLPNTQVFPLTELTSMSVGIGDGVTTEFKPPLNFWVKDTDKIYIDGVLQVRGTDYTCDFYNNLDLLTSLDPSIDAIVIDGYPIIETSSHLSARASGIHFNARNGCRFAQNTNSTDYTTYTWEITDFSNGICTTRTYGIKVGYPLVIYLPIDDDPNKDYSVDTICFYLRYMTSTDIINIEVSDDGVEYTNVAENIKCSDYRYNSSYSDCFMYTLEQPILAKYWRITAVSSHIPDGSFAIENLLMRRTGRPIVFTNPPAAGAKITMDATIDRPFKNDKHVIDISGVYQL